MASHVVWVQTCHCQFDRQFVPIKLASASLIANLYNSIEKRIFSYLTKTGVERGGRGVGVQSSSGLEELPCVHLLPPIVFKKAEFFVLIHF